MKVIMVYRLKDESPVGQFDCVKQVTAFMQVHPSHVYRMLRGEAHHSVYECCYVEIGDDDDEGESM